jgi:hypothetical protein
VLEAVNSLLASGEVPGLWGPEELGRELAALEPRAAEDGGWQAALAAMPSPPAGAAALRAYLLHRMRLNMRVAVGGGAGGVPGS